MSTVYLVSRGEYSDYHVVCVCSTREKAEAMLVRFNGTDPEARPFNEAFIEEMELDAVPQGNAGCYAATVWRNSQDVARSAFWNPDGDPNQPAVPSWEWDNPILWRCATGYGRTLEHARRSAREMARALDAGSVVNPNLDRDIERIAGHHSRLVPLNRTPLPDAELGTPAIHTEDNS